MTQNPCCNTAVNLAACAKEKKTRKLVLIKWLTTFTLEGAEYLSKIR